MPTAVTKSKRKQAQQKPRAEKLIPYTEAVGRRKEATARIRLFQKGAGILVNEKSYTSYFPCKELQYVVEAPLRKLRLEDRFSATVKVYGGGLRGQAEAVRHGISRALVKIDPEFRKHLKRAGFLMRDPRAKERRKYGLKKARRAPQWQKR